MDHKLVIDTAVLAGEILLKSGAETYRVEDTMKHILNTGNTETAEALVMLTGIVAKGGNLAINVGPQPDGRLPKGAVESLKGVCERHMQP